MKQAVAVARQVVARGRPFTGAWIETKVGKITSALNTVAPSRGRGLKHLSLLTTKKPERMVAPSRGRGLKLCCRKSFGARCLRSPLHGGVD